jgi:hypothetical protein
VEDLSAMSRRIRLPLKVRIHPYLKDHRFEGRCVLPAVESLRLLAASVQSQWPDRDVRVMTDALFPRFLFIGEGDDFIAAENDIQIDKQGNLIASLLTVVHSPSGRVTRAKEHVQVCFPQSHPDVEPLPFDKHEASLSTAARLNGVDFEVDTTLSCPQQLYQELVPLGPAYQNVIGDLHLAKQVATAHVRAAIHHQQPGPLGSPFPMDAALHCACAWGQRFAGIVAFPVGFAKRFILRPIVAGETCLACIIPLRREGALLIFDIWIYSCDGAPQEALLGVVMRDVSGGRLKPPAWIQA